jgi:tyrosyl-tRNA synthetase
MLIYKYFSLCTDLSVDELAKIKAQLVDKNTNPRDLKVSLGYELVKKYYNDQSAKAAQQEFEMIFVKKEVPDDIPEIKLNAIGMKLVDIMKETKLAASSSEATRLIKQGGVSINGEKVTDEKKIVKLGEFVLKVGKRKFLKVKN